MTEIVKYTCKECGKTTKAPENKWSSWVRCPQCDGQAFIDGQGSNDYQTPLWNKK